MQVVWSHQVERTFASSHEWPYWSLFVVFWELSFVTRFFLPEGLLRFLMRGRGRDAAPLTCCESNLKRINSNGVFFFFWWKNERSKPFTIFVGHHKSWLDFEVYLWYDTLKDPSSQPLRVLSASRIFGCKLSCLFPHGNPSQYIKATRIRNMGSINLELGREHSAFSC